ncbi:MAG: FG-GAP repeat domain-containing protein [Pseudohongiellaceae bacterium]
MNLILRCVLMLVCLCAPAANSAESAVEWLPFAVPVETRQVIAADLNGDRLQELIAVGESSLRVYLHSADGFNFETGFQDIAIDARAAGWDISARLDSGAQNQQSGASRQGSGAQNQNSGGGESQTGLLLLLDGDRMQRWTLSADGRLQSEIVADNLSGYLSGGFNRLRFVQDINADGLDDWVIPGAGELHLYLNRGGREFTAPLSIQSDFRIRTSLNSNRLNDSAGQSVRIPLMELDDLNGDGHNDLISRTDELLAVFLAEPGAARYFPDRPSYQLDLAAIEEELGEFDIDQLDFSNLTGVLALTHEEILDDINSDGIADLLLREGGKVSLFAGTARGMNFDKPLQVLRSSGNVLSTFLHDEDGDGKKDLWLWRVEPISVGDIFVWLALSGSIGIEAFIYPNEGERFARRPARRITINLRFPSMIRMVSSFRALTEEARNTTSASVTPSARGKVSNSNADTSANAEGNSRRLDLLVLLNNQLEVFLNAIEPEPEETAFLGSLGYSREQDNYEINIRDIINRVSLGDNADLQQVADRTPDFIWPISTPIEEGDVLPARLNNDAFDDILVITGADEDLIRGQLLLSRPVSQ